MKSIYHALNSHIWKSALLCVTRSKKIEQFSVMYICTYRKSTDLLFYHGFFDVANDMFQLTTAMNLGPGEEMCKMTDNLLYQISRPDQTV